MAMVHCWECGKMINEKVDSCPSCGAKQNASGGSAGATKEKEGITTYGWNLIGSTKKLTNELLKSIKDDLLEGEKVDYVVAGAKGIGDFLVVTTERVVIIQKGLINALATGDIFGKAKSFYYKDITSLEVKREGAIQVTVAGDTSREGGFFSDYSSENLFGYGSALEDEMKPVIKKIRTRIRDAKNRE